MIFLAVGLSPFLTLQSAAPRIGPPSEVFAQAKDGRIATLFPRMFSVIQVGFTGLVRVTTIVLLSGVAMLLRLSGKYPGVYCAQFAGEAETAALIMSKLNSRSFDVIGWPLLHFQPLSVMVNVR